MDQSMSLKSKYVFQSERLGFRNWTQQDLESLCAINTDVHVMEFFPQIQNREQTQTFIDRMQKQFTEKGFCYFAVDKLDDHTCIGFIGLNEQIFESDFTPCIDIGWRIKFSEWNKGYCTEGAKRCIQYGFDELNMNSIFSITPCVNKKSEYLMQKIGMHKIKEFSHPLLKDDSRLEQCVLYQINK